MLSRMRRVTHGLVSHVVALGGVAIIGSNPPGVACCVANPAFEKEELAKLLELSSIPKSCIQDFERLNLGSITRLCNFGGGKLALEPPDSTTVGVLMSNLRIGSTLAGVDAWPNPNGSDAEKVAHSNLATSFMALCRYASQLKETALRRELEGIGMLVGGSSAAKVTREEEEKKNHRQKAVDLTRDASVLYSIDFGEPCDSAVLVETYHAFARNRLSVAHLKSGKYGRPSVHLAEKTHFVVGEEGTMKEEKPEGAIAPLTRNANVLEQIFNVTESLVIAGLEPINKNLAHSAGVSGVVRRGQGDEKQVNFDMTTKLKVDRAFTRLSGTLGPKELEVLFEDSFISTLGGLMAEGHSCASGSQNILKTAAWMRPRMPDAAAKTPNGAGASTDAAGSTPVTLPKADRNGVVRGADGEVQYYTAARFQKLQAAHTKQIEQMKASKARITGQFNSGGSQRVRWDDRRRDEHPYQQDARREHHQQQR